jgi:hypothetical protein
VARAGHSSPRSSLRETCQEKNKSGACKIRSLSRENKIDETG